MLMRTDPFRELDRLAQQVLGTAARPAAMPMDAWREDQEFVVAFDLPGVNLDSVDVDVERDVLTVKAERPDPVGKDTELIASERPRGVFSRQLILGDTLDAENVKASYDGGVLTLRVPVTEKAKPRKIEIETKEAQHQIAA
jgi:HSP20 family protein